VGGDRDFKFGMHADRSKYQPSDDKETISEKGVVRSREPYKIWWAETISVEWLMQETSKFVHIHTYGISSPIINMEAWSGSRDPF